MLPCGSGRCATRNVIVGTGAKSVIQLEDVVQVAVPRGVTDPTVKKEVRRNTRILRFIISG